MSRKTKPRPYRHKLPKKVLQVRWLRRLFGLSLSESYGLKINLPSPLDKWRMEDEDAHPRDNRASAETLKQATQTLRSVSNLRHTRAHVDCPACTESFGMKIELAPELTLREAAPKWLDSRRFKLSKASIQEYEKNILRLNPFFGDMQLKDIRPLHFSGYQQDRLAGAKPYTRKAGPVRINHELNTLSQILTRAKLWAYIEHFYEPLPLPKPIVGEALTPAEEEQLFQLASTKKRWRVGYCVWLLTANTTAGWGEISHLRLRDIDSSSKTIHICEGLKNEHRERVLPLNDRAQWAIQTLLKRAEKLGSRMPEHYLLPHRAQKDGLRADPTRPMGSCRKAWEKVRIAMGLPKLRQYDLRHHAITKLLENPAVSEQTAEAIAGHISQKMKRRYAHIRMEAKREALDALTPRPPKTVPISTAHHETRINTA